MTTLVIIGGGGHGKVVAEAAATMGDWRRIVFLDDRFPALTDVLGLPVVGSAHALSDFQKDGTAVAVAIGSNQIRHQVGEQLLAANWRLPVIIHSHAWISPSARLGPGSVVFAQAVLNAGSRCGALAIINTAATVDHDCALADAVHLSPGAHLGGAVTVGCESWIGTGAAIAHGVTIGRSVIVGAGAAVVRNIPDEQTVVGVPARPRP